MNVHRFLWVGCLCSLTALGRASANLIPNPEFRVDSNGQPISWQFWSPRPDLEPRANVASGQEGAAPRFTASRNSASRSPARNMRGCTPASFCQSAPTSGISSCGADAGSRGVRFEVIRRSVPGFPNPLDIRLPVAGARRRIAFTSGLTGGWYGGEPKDRCCDSRD